MNSTMPTPTPRTPNPPFCDFCGRVIHPSDLACKQRHCGPECQKADRQPRLEFGPTASGEENHRHSQRLAILAALRSGKQLTAMDLFGLGGPGFSSRIAELRKAGYPIKTEMVGRIGVYSLAEP